MKKNVYQHKTNFSILEKMRITLTISLLISHFSYGQTESDLRDELELLTNPDSIYLKLDSTGFENLPRINYNCFDQEAPSSWHVQDLNNDRLKDLIYSGPCKPYNQCAIFLNDGTKLIKVFDSPGKILKIELNNFASKVSVLKTSCCCDNYSEFKEIRIDFNNSIEKKVMQLHFETKISFSPGLGTKKISGVLRSKPILNDSIYQDPCSEHAIIGNQILKINNEKVVVLDSKEVWYLVLFKKDMANSLIGWIKED